MIGFDKIVDVLVKNGAKVNEADVSGKTALHQAASFGNIFVLIHIIEVLFQLCRNKMKIVILRTGKSGRTID